MGPCECYVVLTDRDLIRKKLFAGIFQEDHIPISPVEVGLVQAGRGWLMDLTRVTPEQQATIVEKVAKAFNADPKEVAHDLAEKGMPVRSDGAEVHFCPNHLKYGDTYDMRAFI